MILSKRVLGALFALAFIQAAQADVYKWVDENGKTHYSDQPPPTVSTDKMNRVKTDTLDEESKRAAEARMERLRAGESEAEEESSSSSEDKKSGSDLNCSEAVSNAHEWLDSMKEVGRRNVMSGHVKETDYRDGLKKIEELRRNITFSDCNGATGNKRKFYECTSDIRNHVMSCGEKYRP